jgi:hypothetical protein
MIQTKNKYMHKKITSLNNIDKQNENDQFINKIIKPIKEEKVSEQYLKKSIEVKKKELEDNEKEGLKTRKNFPYKGIIKNFDYNKVIKNEKDLIVFRPKDENKETFKEDIKIYKDEIKKQNIENKNVYSEDKKIDYNKKFEYVQKYKYKSNLNNTSEVEGDSLRSDRIEFYKKEQSKIDKNNSIINDIFVDLINKGVLTEDLDNVNMDNFDVDDIEQKLIKEFGKEEYDRLMKEINV